MYEYPLLLRCWCKEARQSVQVEFAVIVVSYYFTAATAATEEAAWLLLRPLLIPASSIFDRRHFKGVPSFKLHKRIWRSAGFYRSDGLSGGHRRTGRLHNL